MSNLELLTGDVFMTDGSEVPATQTPYKLVTTDIESVVGTIEKYWVQTTNYNNNSVPDDLSTLNPVWVDGPSPNPIDTGRQYYDLGVIDATSTTTDANQTIAVSNDGTNWNTLTTAAGFGTTDLVGRYVFLAGSSSDYGLTSTTTVNTLTFPGDVSTNPDLQYFKAGDAVQERL